MPPVRILYVDDDAGLGVLLKKSLAPHGYDIEAVETSAEAMVRLGAETFDLVALDHNLTSDLGLDLIPRIRALPNAPPIIYVTGSDDARTAVSALRAGAVDYVWKDVQGHYRELLRQAFENALAQEKLRRQNEDSQRQVAEARDRAEMLLREVNHRVANSLAMVSSLVQLQANAAGDPNAKEMLLETRARIDAVAGVHRRLYTSADVHAVEINAYLKSLVEELSVTMKPARPLRFVPAAAEILVPTDKVVSLGVIITELVTNAYKYAYPDNREGEIRVSAASPATGKLAIIVADDGVGWTGTGAVLGSGLGTRIVKAMMQSLQADLRYEDCAAGTSVRLELTL